MKEDARQEIIWMDWAKFIGIFLVVFGHLLQTMDNWHHPELLYLWNLIYCFHMPLFFVLSGYMYKESHSFKKIFHTLVIPYFIYQLLFLPAALVMNMRDDGFSFVLLCKQVLGVFLGDGYNTSISYYDCLPCWFIVSMIQIRIIFHFMSINRRSIFLLLIVCPVLLLLFKVYNIDLVFCFDCTLLAIPYFLIGYVLAKRELLSKIKTNGGGYLCSLLCMIILVIVYKVNGPTQMNGPSYGKNLLLNYIGGLAGSLMIIFAVIKIKKIDIYTKQVARNTLFLIFYHWVVLLVFGHIGFFNLWKNFDNFVWAAFVMVAYSILVLYSSIPIICFLNKKYPVVLGKKK